jgi:ribosome recycling factor
MNSSMNIHNVTSVESIDEVLDGSDGTKIPLTSITVTTSDGSVMVINLFDAKEVSNGDA